MSKKAIVTGVTGQDGAYLAQLLLSKGYEVYGCVRRTSRRSLTTLEFLGIEDKIILKELDLNEQSNIANLIRDVQPDEFYNLAAQSFVGASFIQPITTGITDGIAVAYILDAIKTYSPTTKFYQASTSEMYGKVQAVPQSETTPFYPRSPYGCAKLYAHWMTVNYRESYGMFATSGILFNHESELRGPEFVTRKITLNVAKRALGSNVVLELGNLDAKRDWGYAKEYVEGMYLMLQAEKPDTFVLATGETYTIRYFVEKSFAVIGKTVEWKGEAEQEIGYDATTGEELVRVNPEFYRPAEVELLIGDPTKATQVLGWTAKTKAGDLAKIMVDSDIKILQEANYKPTMNVIKIINSEAKAKV
jgi:GDPmannose 4,6-dehydratase